MTNGYADAWVTSEEYGEPAALVGLRAAVAPQYRTLPIERLASTLSARLATMTPEQAEDFLSGLASLGKAIAPVAAQVLPAAAPLIGTAIGGPVGGMLGGLAGQYAGQALAGASGARPAAALPMPGAAPARMASPSPAPAGARAPASMQLLSLLQNPHLLQSILGQIMGTTGTGSVPVGAGGAPAPFGSFMNALSVLANQAASEAGGADEQEDVPAYLLDARGRPRCDPAVPEERAAVLLQELRAAPRAWATAANDPSNWLLASMRD
jgi:hypothetical protein